MAEPDLSRELSAFLKAQPRLLHDLGRVWVVFVDDDLKGHFSDFDEAARFALRHYGDREFFISHTENMDPEIPMFFVDG